MPAEIRGGGRRVSAGPNYTPRLCLNSRAGQSFRALRSLPPQPRAN